MAMPASSRSPSSAVPLAPAHPRAASWDIGLAAALAMIAAITIWLQATRVPVALLDPRNPDIYFSSDSSRVHANMASRSGSHSRTSVHPLFSLTLNPVFHGAALATGHDLSGGPQSSPAISVTRLMSAAAAAAAAGLFFALLRLAGIRRLDAVLFGVMAECSAFWWFWFTVPETYPWGAVSILAALVVALLGARRPTPPGWYVAASIGSLAITTTNWLAGLLAAWVRFDWHAAVKWSAVALGLALGLSLVQKAIFPTSRLFIRPGGEQAYILQQSSGGPVRCWVSFFTHTVVAPEITTAPHSRVEGQVVLRTQFSAPGSGGAGGRAALLGWLLLFGLGLYALCTTAAARPARFLLGVMLLGQLGLHTIYGAETFLYAAHHGFLLIAVAAFATLTRLRYLVLAVALLTSGLMLHNNLGQYERTLSLLSQSQQRLDTLPPRTR